MPPTRRRRTRSGVPVPGHEGQPRPERSQSTGDGRRPTQQRRQDQGPIAVLAQAAAAGDLAGPRHRATATTRANLQASGVLIRQLRAQGALPLDPADREPDKSRSK